MNRGPLLLEVTALPTETKTQPTIGNAKSVTSDYQKGVSVLQIKVFMENFNRSR